MTGVHLSGTVTLQADVALREEIRAWLHAQGKDLDAIRRSTMVAWRDADLSGASELPLLSAATSRAACHVRHVGSRLPNVAVPLP